MMTKTLLVSVLLLALAGCGEKFGAGVDGSAPSVKVKDIILNPDLAGKTVTLEGKINTQCMSNGCWFFLQDDTGQIFVNLLPNNFALPPRMGKAARVSGVISRNADGFELIAKGVKVL